MNVYIYIYTHIYISDWKNYVGHLEVNDLQLLRSGGHGTILGGHGKILGGHGIIFGSSDNIST